MNTKKVMAFACDEPHTIIVRRKHMALWIAYGMYMDKPLRAEDRTETGSISGGARRKSSSMPAQASAIRASCRRRCCEFSRIDPTVSRARTTLRLCWYARATSRPTEEEKVIGYGRLSPAAPREQRMKLVGKEQEVEHQDQRECQKQPVSHGCLPTDVTA